MMNYYGADYRMKADEKMLFVEFKVDKEFEPAFSVLIE